MRQVRSDHCAVQHRLWRGLEQLFLHLHCRQVRALHMQEVVIKMHFGQLGRRQDTEHHDDSNDGSRTAQPDVLQTLPPLQRVSILVIDDVLLAF
ncbi:hypothetical protein SDC9_212941 [bioreactor metagenome]|uniref:Uncharacterized protein n=1 Tax=bioreactor metagenome TaxID=1076179 RepID=A0A645JPD4_9ZZZZ